MIDDSKQIVEEKKGKSAFSPIDITGLSDDEENRYGEIKQGGFSSDEDNESKLIGYYISVIILPYYICKFVFLFICISIYYFRVFRL